MNEVNRYIGGAFVSIVVVVIEYEAYRRKHFDYLDK